MNLEPGMEWHVVSGAYPDDAVQKFKRVKIAFKSKHGLRTHLSPMIKHQLFGADMAIIDKWYMEEVIPDYKFKD